MTCLVERFRKDKRREHSEHCIVFLPLLSQCRASVVLRQIHLVSLAAQPSRTVGDINYERPETKADVSGDQG